MTAKQTATLPAPARHTPVITREEIQALYAPFPLKDHEVREGSTKNSTQWFVYVQRQSIIRRLDEVFPGEWSYEVVNVSSSDNHATSIGRLTIRGIIREFNGGNSGNSGEDNEKGAVTDTFKRVASMWGIGLYLQDAPQLWTKGGYKKSDGVDWDEKRKQEQEALNKFARWLTQTQTPPATSNGSRPALSEVPDDAPEPVTEPAPEYPWPSKESLKELYDVARRKLIPAATDAEIANLAGITTPFDLKAWAIYPDRNSAANQIKYVWEKPAVPARNGTIPAEIDVPF